MKIGHLDTSERVAIVAEIGLNHEGDYMVARQLVEEAADAGADAVKFQVYNVLLYGDPSDRERYERLARFELPPGAFDDLVSFTHDCGLEFIATPFDLESADLCNEICDAVKIASKDIDFWPLLDRVAAGDRPMILSTGMSDLERVIKTVRWVYCKRATWPAVLHCVSAYPAPFAQAQLRAIRSFAAPDYPLVVGYSDHTVSMNAAPLAVALGARIIEKHFTLDKNQSDFRDHKLSLTPAAFSTFAQRIRVAEVMLGKPDKRVMPCEADTIAACERERTFRESVLAR